MPFLWILMDVIILKYPYDFYLFQWHDISTRAAYDLNTGYSFRPLVKMLVDDHGTFVHPMGKLRVLSSFNFVLSVDQIKVKLWFHSTYDIPILKTRRNASVHVLIFPKIEFWGVTKKSYTPAPIEPYLFFKVPGDM